MLRLLRSIVSFCVLCFCAGVCFAQPVARVGFYNLCNFFDLENDPSVEDSEYSSSVRNDFGLKVRELSSAIGLFSPDLLGVCEVENYGCLDSLVSAMDFRGYGIVHYDSRDSRGIDCAILYDTMVFELEGSDFLDFEYLKRGVVCARFVYRSTGRCVTVFSVHLPSRLGGGRASALRSLALRALDSISYCTPTPVIVMGDMNSEPKHLGSLYNCAVVPFGLGVGSYVYRDVWSMPCQILVSYQLRPYVFGDQRVVLDSSLLTPSGRFRGYPHRNRPSDHLPVYIDIEL